MIKFAFIYALPGFKNEEIHRVATESSEFYAVAVDFMDRETTVEAAEKLVKDYGVKMIELCGGLANADLVAKVKQAVGKDVSVGQVMYGPEFRRPLVEYLNSNLE